MLITIIEFAEGRNEKPATVAQWIRRHPEMEPYITIQGRELSIDTESEGFRLLEKAYPPLKPVEIVDKDLMQDLLKMQKAVIQLQEQLRVQQEQLIGAEKAQLLLEDRERQLEDAKIDAKKAEQKQAALEQEKGEMQRQLDKLRDELQEARQNVAEHEMAEQLGFFAFRRWKKSREKKQ